MLISLTIKNFALIESIELAFDSGLTVITGETGAGKTILVGALGLLLGERASTDAIRAGAEKAIVEGEFSRAAAERVSELLAANEIEPRETLLIRREISLRGQSRCFVNDTPVPLAVLREIGDVLVDMHGQHEHQSLLRPETHIDFLDAFAGADNAKIVFQKSFRELEGLFSSLHSLRNREKSLKERSGILQYQLHEIDAISPQPGEDENIQQELKRAQHVEQLFTLTAELQALLYDGERSVHDQLSQALQHLGAIETIDSAFTPWLEEARGASIAIDGIAQFLRRYAEQLEFDPATLEEKRTRLFAIGGLKKKYGGTLDAVIALREEAARELRTAENFEGEIAALESAIARERALCSAHALMLSSARTRAAARLERAIAEALKNLGIAAPNFSIQLTTREIPEANAFVVIDGKGYAATEKGIDAVEFYLSTNAGEPPKPLAKTASGGEVSRVMLALKSALAAGDKTPVLVFDEIDTGISGRIAQKTGAAMRALATHHQVIAITHLPQIAGSAQHHFAVEKKQSGGKTVTTVEKLTEKQRLHEIAKLLSGEIVTDASLKTAKELMAG